MSTPFVVLRRRWRALPRPAATGVVLLGVFVVIAAVGPLVAPDDPSATSVAALAAPSWHHLLGTTQTGQDVLSQLLVGARVSLLVGTVAGLLTTVVAAAVGMAAGYLRGVAGEAVTSLVNLFLVLPVLPLVIVMSAYLRSSGWLGVVAVIVAVGWATGARVVRAQARSLRQRDFVAAARASGERPWRILWTEVLPHVLPVLASGFVTAMLFAVVTQASLAFIGLGGVDQWSWGTMLYWAQNADAFSVGAWWWIVPPGACLALLGTSLVLVNFGVDTVVAPVGSGAGHRPGAPASASGGAPAPGSRGGPERRTAPAAQPPPQAACPPAGEAAHLAPPVVGPRRDVPSLLTVEALSVVHGDTPALQGVDLQVGWGEVVGIAGETGSGKSTLVHAVTRLLREPSRVTGGRIWLHPRPPVPGHAGVPADAAPRRAGAASGPVGLAPGPAGAASGPAGAAPGPADLLGLDAAALRLVRWERVAFVPQAALHALNPVLPVRAQLVDVVRAHRPGVGRRDAAEWAAEALLGVGLERRHLASYAHELSGGMRQRVLIAMALLLRPDLVVLDEPTTALDPATQRAVVEEVLRLQRTLGFAVILVTHDLSLLLEVADTVAVLHGGRVVEHGDAGTVHRRPAHPYTAALLAARLPVPRRTVGDPGPWPSQPQPQPRPSLARPSLAKPLPTVEQRPGPVLAADGLCKSFRARPAAGAGVSGSAVQAVDGVSLALYAGRATALVGASGSGKSTVARLLARLDVPDAGRVVVDGCAPGRGRRAELAYRRRVQLVLQDPYASLNPARTVGSHLRRAVRLHRVAWAAGAAGVPGGAADDDVARALLARVGLVPDDVLDRLPAALSGGQRQRVAIARALAARPAVLIADEPVSMLDVSVRAGILAVLDELRAEHGMALLHITHDVAAARASADEVLVMDAGRVVEAGPAEEVLGSPAHPATRRLVDAQPDPGRRRATRGETLPEGGGKERAAMGTER